MGVCAARQRQSVRPASPNDLPEAANDEHAAPSFSQCGQILRHSRVGTPRPAPPALRVCGDRPRRRPGARSSLFFWFQGPSCARRSDAPPRARVCFEVAPRSPWRVLPPPPTPKSARMPHLVALLAAPFGSRTAAQALRGRALRRAARGSRGGRAHQAPHDRHARASSCQPRHAAAQLPTSRWAATLTIPGGTRPAAGKGSRRQHRLRHAPQPSTSPAEGSGAASARHGASDAQCTL